MKNKFLLAIVTAVGISAVATTAVAAPLPAGTLLRIAPSTDLPAGGSVTACTTGSCFGAYIGPAFSFFYWTPLNPGADGGIVIGKPQLSGGQEINRFSTADGQLSAVWNFGAEWGTFFTAPDATGNIFDDASCTGSACLGKTELKVWNMAWNGTVVPAGSASGCNKLLLSNCTFDQVAGIFVKSWTINPVEGGAWRLTYNQVVPEVLPNMVFELILSGTVHFPQNQPPVVTVTPANLTGFYGVPIPFTISVSGGIPTPPTCLVDTAPANGKVVLNDCFSGTYTANIGFIGTDSFSVIANDGLNDSAPATVTAAITPPIVIDYWCTDTYPVAQTTLTGKQGHLTMTVTGNIITVNPNGKEIKICPATTASYNVVTNTPGATVVCKVKSNTSRGKGNVKVNDHIKCTDKPIGNDKLGIKIKSGVNQKAM